MNAIDPTALRRVVPERLAGSPASVLYQAGLLLVVFAMVLLPLLYLGLVAATAYGVFWHATEHISWLQGGGARGRLIVYASPIAAGVVLIVFLLKPFLTRPAVSDSYRPLRREEAPLLFALVRRIAAAVGAPPPDRIDIDLRVNASASRQRNEEGRQLVLTVGLPLVAGLSLRQLAGVLAHEFGHFGQGVGMRASGWIRTINFWFARLVYERDQLDAKLAEGRDSSGYVMVFAAIASLAVWLSRRLLWILMQAGHAISCTFMRQMEFDADRYEIALAGSVTFEETAHALGRLNHATDLAMVELRDSWREGRLGDDLPRLVALKARDLPEGDRVALARHTEAGRSGLFDTHPSDRERIERARRAALPGYFDLEAPGSAAFADFEALSRAMTLDYYEDVIGPTVHETPLVASEALIERSEKLATDERALACFFPVLASDHRFLDVRADAVGPPDQPREAVQRLRELRRAVEERRKAIGEVYRRHFRESERRHDALSAQGLIDAGIQPDAETFHLPRSDRLGVERALERASANLEQTRAEIEAFETLAAERLRSALSLLLHPRVQERLGAAARPPEEIVRWLRAHAGLLAHEPILRAFADRHIRLAILLANHPGRESQQALTDAIVRGAGELSEAGESMLRQLRGIEFPFAHGEDRLSVAQHLLPEGLPSPDDPHAVAAAAQALLERAAQLHDRILAALAAAAQPAEEAVTARP